MVRKWSSTVKHGALHFESGLAQSSVNPVTCLVLLYCPPLTNYSRTHSNCPPIRPPKNPFKLSTYSITQEPIQTVHLFDHPRTHSNCPPIRPPKNPFKQPTYSTPQEPIQSLWLLIQRAITHYENLNISAFSQPSILRRRLPARKMALVKDYRRPLKVAAKALEHRGIPFVEYGQQLQFRFGYPVVLFVRMRMSIPIFSILGWML
jgi:hypothetical protein